MMLSSVNVEAEVTVVANRTAEAGKCVLGPPLHFTLLAGVVSPPCRLPAAVAAVRLAFAADKSRLTLVVSLGCVVSVQRMSYNHGRNSRLVLRYWCSVS